MPDTENHEVLIIGSGETGKDMAWTDRKARRSTLYLEGEELKVVELGRTDTVHSTALHVPSIGPIVSGDAVYNNTHLYLAECDRKARREWLRTLDKVEALHARAVVAGHGVLDPDSSPRHVEETRRYIRDFNVADAGTATVMRLYEKMLALHPLIQVRFGQLRRR